MAKKWSPSKEHRGPQHNTPYYDQVVGVYNKTSVKGAINNDGLGSEGGTSYPVPPIGKHGTPKPKDKIGKINPTATKVKGTEG